MARPTRKRMLLDGKTRKKPGTKDRGGQGKPNIVLISGMSGSGKSSALKILEDKGFFCVDNMPVVLLPKFFELGLSARLKNVLFVMDIREKSFLGGFGKYINFLKKESSSFKFIFFDSADDVLIRRYSESRRKHPLAENDIRKAIARERFLLRTAKAAADVLIDTSAVKVHDLESILLSRLEGIGNPRCFSVRIVSFGFKYGLPLEADTVFDVRFMPNPYFVPSLKNLTGMSLKIAKYILSSKESDKFIGYLKEFMSFTLPLYMKENKSYLTVCIGCTGGVHRSVFVAEELKRRLGETNDVYNIEYFHRDIGK